MAFQLRIARGHQEGRSYLIGQKTLRVGSGVGNDVVLSDAGVSQMHLQIVEREGRYFVIDLKSSNGTWLNGEPLEQERELKTGDALAVGAALLSFVQVDGEGAKARPLVPVETNHETRPERVGKPNPPRPFADDDATAPLAEPLRAPPAAKGADQDPTAPDGQPLGARLGPDTTAPNDAEAVAASASLDRLLGLGPEPSGGSLSPLPLGASDLAEPSINRLLGVELEAPREDPSHGSLPPLEISRSELNAFRTQELKPEFSEPSARPLSAGSDPSLSAASLSEPSGISGVSSLSGGESTRDERPTRFTDALAPRAPRRGLLARVLELPAGVRTVFAALAGLLVVLAGAQVYRLVRGPAEPSLPPEPDQLTKEPIALSFGLGPGVDYERADQKELYFDVPVSPPSAVLLHYEASEVEKGEVAILVNNADLGFVPPDLGVSDRQLETLVPPELLKRGARNVVTFDNVKNPPGRESWRVAHLSYELWPLSPLEAGEAVKHAEELVDRGNRLYTNQKAAPGNLFLAWKAYREAWLTLVGVNVPAVKTLSPVAKAKEDEVGQQLDRECARLLLEAKKAMEQKQPEEARRALDSVGERFPGEEHRCRSLANERRDEYLLR